MARDTEAERRPQNSEPATDAAVPEAAPVVATPAEQAQFSTDGPIPEVAGAAPAAAAPAVIAAPEATPDVGAADPAVAAPVTADPAVAAAAPDAVVEVPAGATAAEAATKSASEQAFEGGEQKAATADPAATEELKDEAKGEGKTAKDEKPKGDAYDLDRGVYDWRDYQKACADAGAADKWRDEYKHGHTEAQQFVNPHEHGATMSWQLKAGQSASEAISSWLDGPTIADTAVAATARQIDDVRLAIGDRLFDQLFGSADQTEDASIAMHQRLHIKADHGNLVQNMMKIGYDAQGALASTGNGKLAGGDLDDDDLSYFSNDKKAETAPPQELDEEQLGAETAQAERAEVSAKGTGDAAYADAYMPEVALAAAVTVPAPQVTVPAQVTVPEPQAQVTVPATGFLANASEQVATEDQKKARVGA